MNFTAAKAKVAAIGTTLTAVTTAWATVQVATADGSLDAGDISTIITAVVVAVGTIYGVWRVENKPKADTSAL